MTKAMPFVLGFTSKKARNSLSSHNFAESTSPLTILQKIQSSISIYYLYLINYMSDYSEQLRVAAHAAKEAGKLLRDLFDKAHTVKEKSKFEGFVTEADLASEKIILSELKKAFPDYSILSEEAGEERKNSNYMWLVDPLDGTTNFKIKNPFFNVSIGLAKGKQIVMGVIYSPILDELFYSIEGRGAYLNGKKISISDTSNFSSSVIAFCHGGKNQKAIERALKIYSKLKLLSNHTRQFGAAALEFCYLAAGRSEEHTSELQSQFHLV